MTRIGSQMLATRRNRTIDDRREGYVLLAVLIVIVVLSLAAYRYSDMMSAEYRASNRILRNAEAKALADSGIHYAMALLADKTAFSASPLNGNPYDNRDAFMDRPLGNGRFSIVSIDYANNTGTGNVGLKYGAIDEAGKININALFQLDPSGVILFNVLTNPNGLAMPPETANAILDWIDPKETTTRSGGAKDEYYMGRTPPYHCKNGPLDSIEELLLVKGITPELLFGNDLNRNGRRDPEEGGGEFSFGWAPYLTVYSREKNVDLDGNARINVNGKTLKTIYDQIVPLIGQNLAAYVIAYRAYDLPSATNNNNNKQEPPKEGQIADLVKKVESDLNGKQAPRGKRTISSLLLLLGTSVQVAGQNNQPATIYAFPTGDDIRDVLPTILDKLTTVSDADLPGRINVNTAPREVLATLPGLDTADVEAIFAHRPAGGSDAADPVYQTPAWLYTEANLAVPKLQGLERYVTARTQVYRIQSIGYFPQGGPMVRVEAVVDVNDGKPRILYYRDLTELGRSIDPRGN